MNSAYIRELFENDQASLREYYLAFLEELDEIARDFERAASQRDYQVFRDAAHKSKTSIELLKAKQLQSAIQSARSIYQSAEWPELPSATRCLLQEVENAKSFLHAELRSLA